MKDTLEGASNLSDYEDFRRMSFSQDCELLATASNTSVKLWDLRTKEVRTLCSTDKVFQLAFSREGSFLETNIGTLELEIFPSGECKLQPDRSLCFTSCEESEWVSWATKKILWLPDDYRGSCIAAQDNLFAMANKSGKITVIEIDPKQLPS